MLNQALPNERVESHIFPSPTFYQTNGSSMFTVKLWNLSVCKCISASELKNWSYRFVVSAQLEYNIIALLFREKKASAESR